MVSNSKCGARMFLRGQKGNQNKALHGVLGKQENGGRQHGRKVQQAAEEIIQGATQKLIWATKINMGSRERINQGAGR